MTIRLATALLMVVLGFVSGFPRTLGDSSPRGVLVRDLRPYGFPDFAKVHHVSDYTDLQFLSDHILLVVVNERAWDKSEEPLNTDQPTSRLLLFDLDQGKLIKTAEYAVEKFSGSVLATNHGQFVVLNGEGVHPCSEELVCGRPYATEGPIRILPGGTRLLAGGNSQSELILLDASTMQILRRPAPQNIRMGLMSGTLLDGREIISDEVVADTAGGSSKEMQLEKTSGGFLYSIKVTADYETTLVANQSGLRFCALEESYTRWNALVNFLDIDNTRPHNFARVRVFDTISGKELFEMNWDPRPSQAVPTPALSPDGHKLALIRHSELDVFEIP